MSRPRIVVIGGGISGLAAAHRVIELSRQWERPAELVVLEASARLGGVIHTRRHDGFLLEQGPDAFVTEKPWAVELCRRLGLADELIETRPEFRRSWIVRGGRLRAVPAGCYLVAPVTLRALLALPMIGWAGKLRMACEPLIPPRRDPADESVASFIRRRFGREAFERLGQPMVGGIYTADAERLSAHATMPVLTELERRDGSVWRGLRRRAEGSEAPLRAASGPRYSLFQTLRGGVGKLIETLASRMPSSVHCNRRVDALVPGPRWSVRLGNGESIDADGVCLAIPAPQAARLLADLAPGLASELAAIRCASVATVQLAIRRNDWPQVPAGAGFVVPAIERSRLIGCTIVSHKFAGRSPDDVVLLRAFLGGDGHEDVLSLDDDRLVAVVREELRRFVGLRAEPVLTSVARLPSSMPQYEVGHRDRVAAIEAAAARMPRLALTGNSFDGIGIPDCIRHAEAAAQRLVEGLRSASAAPSSIRSVS